MRSVEVRSALSCENNTFSGMFCVINVVPKVGLKRCEQSAYLCVVFHLSCRCSICRQPISCALVLWLQCTIDQQQQLLALNPTQSAESSSPHRPKEQGSSKMSKPLAKLPRRIQKYAYPEHAQSLHEGNKAITTFVVIQSRCRGVLLKSSGAVRKTLMPKRSDADREQTVRSHLNTFSTNAQLIQTTFCHGT